MTKFIHYFHHVLARDRVASLPAVGGLGDVSSAGSYQVFHVAVLCADPAYERHHLDAEAVISNTAVVSFRHHRYKGLEINGHLPS